MNGKESPVTENSDPPTFAADTVTGPPLADMVPGWLFFVPTTTLPKFTPDGDRPICPPKLPVPDNATESVVLDAFELILSFPVNAPLVSGLKLTWNVALWPGLKVTGGLIPLKLKPVPLAIICEIVIALLAEFVRVSEEVLTVEVCTGPKLMLVGVAKSEPDEVVPFPVI